MSESFFDSTPAPATPEATPAAAPAPTQTAATPEAAATPEPTLPDYEHDALKTLAGGKYRRFEDVDKTIRGASDQIRKLNESAAAMKVRLGQFAGPPLAEDGTPRPYQIKAAEDFPLAIDAEAPEFQELQEIATRYGAPEGMLQELHDRVLLPQIKALVERNHEAEAADLAEYYGSPEAMVAGARETSRWLMERLGEDKVDLLKRAMSTADAAYVFDLIRKGWGDVSLADKGSGPASVSVADLRTKAFTLRNGDPEMKNAETKAAWAAMNEAEAASRQKAA